MKYFLHLLYNFVANNTKDPYKSIAHFARSGATSVIIMICSGFLISPIFRYFGGATNYKVVDEIIILATATVVLLISKAFIKE